jgi:hypothetical protein
MAVLPDAVTRAGLAVMVSAALSAAIWALSIPFTGKSEPWDAESPYYFVALAISGAISGAIVPKRLWAHYFGAMLGQVAYELAFLKLGPLVIVGLVFLAGYSLVFVAAAAIMASLRKDPPSEPTAV